MSMRFFRILMPIPAIPLRTMLPQWISIFADDEQALSLRFAVEMPDGKIRTILLIDEEHDPEPVERVVPDEGRFWLVMKPNQ